jgi:hypothetical protein
MRPIRFLAAFLALATSILATSAHAQTTPPPTGPYIPLETFQQITLPGPINEFRSASGAPGAHYWQNRADYTLHATLDTATKTLHGDEIITYTNNSPDTLDVLWLNIEQNTYRQDSRAKAMSGGGRRRSGDNHTDGYTFESVELLSGTNQKASASKADYILSDTRMQLRLPHPLAPHAVVRVKIAYHYTIPGVWGGRTSWAAYKQGDIYDIAQWYPRLCVYDDLRGWNTEPYLANEFFLEYGNFDYTVTVPANFIVSGSGELVNPAGVLTKSEQTNLARARNSDTTVMLRTAADVAAAIAGKTTATKTWHFRMTNTRDVAWSASPTFLWDAARINLPDNKKALAQSVYPIEAVGPDAWDRSTQYIKDTVEHMSARWYPYPYPNAINVAGPTEGMEYPGIVFDGPEERGVVAFFVGAHEIGHTWFPMIVGSNERRDAFMDEGFNTFIDTFESDDFNRGEYAPKRDSEYAPEKGIAPADQIVTLLKDPDAPPIVTRADAIPEKYRHPVTYFKAAFGLTLLRDDILGPERFDHAFRKYIADWAYKHPSPSDFMREMESDGGEDLGWFWQGYYFHNWQMDMRVTAVVANDNGPGVKVTVTNFGKLVLPTNLLVSCADGSKIETAVPVETWMQNKQHTFVVGCATNRTATAILDPDHKVPLSVRGTSASTE